MKKNYDVIVIGLGVMGSSACHSLSRQGVKVLGLEQFSMAHSLGSSHGQVRMIRQAYFEHPDYVPLLKEAYVRWDELCQLSNEKLFCRTGLLMMAPEGSGTALDNALKSATLHGIPVEPLSSAGIQKRFSQFSNVEGFRGVFELGGGYLQVENTIKAYCTQAEKCGAELSFNERVITWKATNGKVEIKTDKHDYETEKVIFTAGPWTLQILSQLGLPLQVRRATQFWFESAGAGASKRELESDKMPCFAFDMPYGFIYGFPNLGNGVKVANHKALRIISDPYQVDRQIYDEDTDLVKRCVTQYLPNLNSTPSKSSVCMYTMSPDEHFIIDTHPEYSNVAFAGGFSGHGFKFASVVGPVLADLVLHGNTSQPIDFLRLRWS